MQNYCIQISAGGRRVLEFIEICFVNKGGVCLSDYSIEVYILCGDRSLSIRE